MALSNGAYQQTASERRNNILGSKISSQNERRLTAVDYDIKTYALSDKQSSEYL